MSQGNVSISVELFGIGALKGTIIRHLAPGSADAILDKMPFVMRGRFGPTFSIKNYWTIPAVGIRKGPDLTRAKKPVEKGEIIYNPKTDELIIILEDMEMPNKVNKVGQVEINDLEFVLKATNGLNTKFIRKKN